MSEYSFRKEKSMRFMGMEGLVRERSTGTKHKKELAAVYFCKRSKPAPRMGMKS